MMLLLEKLENESSEDVRVYVEALLWTNYTKLSAEVSERLPFGEWKTLLRVDAQIEFMGKTFCSIEWRALRTYVCLRGLIESGAISRDAIVMYRRMGEVEESTEYGSRDPIVVAFLLREGKAKRLACEEVLALLPPSLHWRMPFFLGRDLDDRA